MSSKTLGNELGSEATLQGSTANEYPLSRVFVLAKKFSEPGAVSSSAPTNFRPTPCGFSLRPTGADSTYSRPVLAARGNLRAAGTGVKGAKGEELANCGLFLLTQQYCCPRL